MQLPYCYSEHILLILKNTQLHTVVFFEYKITLKLHRKCNMSEESNNNDTPATTTTVKDETDTNPKKRPRTNDTTSTTDESKGKLFV